MHNVLPYLLFYHHTPEYTAEIYDAIYEKPAELGSDPVL